jgi:hypothetical protein
MNEDQCVSSCFRLRIISEINYLIIFVNKVD